MKRWLACALVGLITARAHADDAQSATLTLSHAEEIALAHQPFLEAQTASIHSARARAVAAEQLPDPMLMTGLKDLPINGDPAFTVDRDDFTMFTVGFRQEVPRRAKRRLRGERGAIEVRAGEFELESRERETRRDTALAWLDVYHGERALVPVRRLVREYEVQAQAMEISLRTNRAPQADLLAARVELGLARDRVRGLERDIARSRATLARFIEDDARRPLPDDLPPLPQPPPLEPLLSSLRTHPHLNRYSELIRLAENDIAQAKEAYKPDPAVSLEYGYRRVFPDFVGVRFELDLPVFTRQRQDRQLEARLADAEEVTALRADTLRQHEAEARTAWIEWQSALERLRAFETDILPGASQRVDAARSAYESANTEFADVLLARRAALEADLLALEQRVDIARAQVRVRYFTD